MRQVADKYRRAQQPRSTLRRLDRARAAGSGSARSCRVAAAVFQSFVPAWNGTTANVFCCSAHCAREAAKALNFGEGRTLHLNRTSNSYRPGAVPVARLAGDPEFVRRDSAALARHREHLRPLLGMWQGAGSTPAVVQPHGEPGAKIQDEAAE